MISLLAIIFFLLGLIIGSFLNVVIFRINTRRSFGGRSACMSCANKLVWYELLPVFSFLGLRGRCRNCKTRISIQYPLVEFLAGLIFMALFYKFKYIFFLSPFVFSVTYIYYAFAFSLLFIIAVYDLKHKIIPDVCSVLLGIFAFIGLFFFHSGSSPLFYFHHPSVFEFLSGILIALPFALLWLFSGGRWMGFGDAKLALGIGWLLGFSQGFSSLVVAFWSGAIVGVALIVVFKGRGKGRFGMKSEIPFAPFLALAAFLTFISGLNLFDFHR